MTERELSNKRRWVLGVLEEHEARLTRFAARLLGDEETARDVVQHAFLRLCNQSSGELEGRVAQWLFTVCRNRAVDILRSRQRTASLGEMDAGARVSNEPDPALVAERHDLYRRLNGLVAELPTNQREAVDLWTEGFTYREIAEITGHGEGNVRVLVHRALKTLRGHPLARQWAGGPAETSRRAPEQRRERV
jgi:RNA polymerase sigma-70 factor (ECF subfamily)